MHVWVCIAQAVMKFGDENFVSFTVVCIIAANASAGD
jgi:hypothetical protein